MSNPVNIVNGIAILHSTLEAFNLLVSVSLFNCFYSIRHEMNWILFHDQKIAF